MNELIVQGKFESRTPDHPIVVDVAQLEKSLRRPRSAFNVFMSGATALMTISALVPLFSVVFMLLVKGGERLSFSLFTQLPPAAFEQG
ncbi:MAG: hypothetical protein AAGU11_05650, partial [Syntrophobacteraceae bacterium]